MKNEIFQPGFEKNRKEGKIEKKEGENKKIFSKQQKTPLRQTTGPSVAHLTGFEPVAYRLGERKSVRPQYPPSARKCLLLLGF